MKPIGKVRAIQMIPSESTTAVAVRALIICEDEKGNKFSYSAPSFVGDLSVYNQDQGMTWRDWSKLREDAVNSHQRRWAVRYLLDVNRMITDYKAGIKFDDLPEESHS